MSNKKGGGKGAGAKEVRQYAVNETVLGKIRGYPPWPGIVRAFSLYHACAHTDALVPLFRSFCLSFLCMRISCLFISSLPCYETSSHI
jgi:hypothetical protein